MTQHTGKCHVPAERLREILDALGMAPTRDWDDVLNAARCLHKNASGDAVAPGEQPDDEVARLRSVLAGRERELKAALTQVHELRTAADTGQARETARHREGSGAGWPRVAGRCPGCNRPSLFLAAGEHVTCSHLNCPAPCAADDLLHPVTPSADTVQAPKAEIAGWDGAS